VGAFRDPGSPLGGGAAYVFTRSGSVWTKQARLDSPAAGSDTGRAVAVSGDVAVVGAPGYGGGKGAVLVFTRSGAAWTLSQTLTGYGATAERFGIALAFDGTSIVAGAPPSVGVGNAYVFRRNPSDFELVSVVSGASVGAQPFGEFGASVAVEGNLVFVGEASADAPGPKGTTIASAGRARLFRVP
jgi:hypothetical protein